MDITDGHEYSAYSYYTDWAAMLIFGVTFAPQEYTTLRELPALQIITASFSSPQAKNPTDSPCSTINSIPRKL